MAIFPDDFTEDTSIDGTEKILVSGAKKYVLGSKFKEFVQNSSALTDDGVVVWDNDSKQFITVTNFTYTSGKLSIDKLKLNTTTSYADKATAIAAGLGVGDIYLLTGAGGQSGLVCIQSL